jgi:hypothetical protein
MNFFYYSFAGWCKFYFILVRSFFLSLAQILLLFCFHSLFKVLRLFWWYIHKPNLLFSLLRFVLFLLFCCWHLSVKKRAKKTSQHARARAHSDWILVDQWKRSDGYAAEESRELGFVKKSISQSICLFVWKYLVVCVWEERRESQAKRREEKRREEWQKTRY